MKQARSIFLGGELIDINDVFYPDYFNKGLICPFCLEKVFFAKDFERVINDKIVKVSASFRHYKGDPSSCELRSQSHEGKEILNLISNESKEQRKLLWEKYLWSMFKAGVYANKDLSRFDLSHIGKIVLETPLSKPIKFKLLANEDTPNKYISLEELGFVLAYTFCLLPFNYDYEKEYIKTKSDDIAQKLMEDLPDKSEDLINISNKIKSAIYSKDFYTTTHVKTNPSLHHSICMEVFKVLANPDLSKIHERVLLFVFLNINESSPMPEEVLHSVFQLFQSLQRTNWHPNQAKIMKLRDIQDNLLKFLFYVYVEHIISIDWYELSQQPWQNLAKKEDIIKRVPGTCGKGFGQTKHNKK